MKISPVNNYKKPGYALKIAALLTAAASVSGCAENTGAVTTTGNTAPAPAYKQTASGQITSAEEAVTTPAATAPDTGTYTTTVPAGTVMTTAETTEPAETSSADDTTAPAITTSAAAVTTAAVITTALTTTSYEACEVDGMLEAPEEDEYEEAELEGDVAMPEDHEPMYENFCVIQYLKDEFTDEDVWYARGLSVEFETNDGGFESDIHVEFVNFAEDDYANNAYIIFVDRTNAVDMAMFGNIKGADKTAFGYLAEGNMYGETAKFAIVLIHGSESVISDDNAKTVLNAMLDADWIDGYKATELEGDVEMPEEEVDTTTHDYAVRSIDSLKKAFADVKLKAVIPDEKVSDSVWVRGSGHSVIATLDVGLDSKFASYTPIYLSFIDTNDKNTLSALKEMGAVEYKYGFIADTEFMDMPIRVIFVEVADFTGKLSASAAKKLITELNTVRAFDFEVPDVELEGEPYIPEE